MLYCICSQLKREGHFKNVGRICKFFFPGFYRDEKQKQVIELSDFELRNQTI